MRMHLSWVLLLAGCWKAESPPVEAPVTATSPTARTTLPSVELVGAAELQACQASTHQVLEGGLPCDEQSLEGGAPLRYRHLPAISRDGSVIAVVEERDGWHHISPGLRLIDHTGRSVQWIPLDGTDHVARAAVARANAELGKHAWVALEMPRVTTRELANDGSETTLSFGGNTVVYQQRHNGNWRLPPAHIRVTTAAGRVVAERTDTEHAWSAEPACNMPSFELIGASAAPGVVLFKTGLGMGGHNCDGVKQPPTWHVLRFP